MVKICGNCAYMLDDGDGSEPYCARRDLYYNVQPQQKGCADWRSNENKLECGLARYHADMMKRGSETMVGKNEKITALEAHQALELLVRLESSIIKTSGDMTILLSAEECVKKQIPEMVLEQKDPHKCGVYHGRCPDCGSNGVDSDRHNFCPACGKALLWKEPWTD